MPTPEEIEAKRLEDEAKRLEDAAKLQAEAAETEHVPKKAFSEVSSSMHKYKAELKETKLLLNQLQAEQDATKTEQLAEQGRWEELYKKSQEKLEVANQDAQTTQDKFINYHKKNSVLNTIGGFKRDEYNSFINVESIGLNDDGSVETSSLEKEIDRIKQTYPELIKIGSADKLPNGAPTPGNPGDIEYKNMTLQQRSEYKRKLLKGS